MGMPVPDRPHAIIFGSTEDDVTMTDGLDGIQEKMTVGFMELTEDISLRLPSFINRYDAIILGNATASAIYIIAFIRTIDSAPCSPQYISYLITTGDGSFQYVKSFLGDVLGIDASQLRKKRGMNLFERGLQDIF